MSRKIRRGSATLVLAAALFVSVPAPSWAGERNGTLLFREAWSWLARLWPAPGAKEGSMIDPNGSRKPVDDQPTTETRPDEGSMIDPNGSR